MRIPLPESAVEIAHRLNEAGFQAYVVGGYVRDYLIYHDTQESYDIDFCTDATPEQMKEVFTDYPVYDTGIEHGTLTISNGESYEVTTFRSDENYSDCRHCDVVWTATVEEDLARRDFTMNAIAYDPLTSTIVDPFGGMNDISQRVIKCVGNPTQRFGEDALRILRAVRFAAKLNFSIDSATEKAIHSQYRNILRVSRERINKELYTMFSCDSSEVLASVLYKFYDVMCCIIPTLKMTVNYNQNHPYHCFDLYQHLVSTVCNIESTSPEVRLAAYLHDIAKPECADFSRHLECGDGVTYHKHNMVSAERAEHILATLRFSNEIINHVTRLVRYHDCRPDASAASVKRWMNRMGSREMFNEWYILAKADAKAHYPALWANMTFGLPVLERIKQIADTIYDADEFFNKNKLAVNGYDLRELGFSPGPLFSTIFEDCYNKVIEDVLENDKEVLISYIKSAY